MKNKILSFVMAAVFLAPVVLTSCGDDEPVDPQQPQQPLVDNKLAGTLEGTLTLDASVEYLLDGALIVENGGVLNIPAGTTIKAKKGFGQYILVLQGGKINVNGTAEAPVTMTANIDNAEAGHWGGLVINGNAPLAGGTKGSTEINSSYPYGGDNAADNSGTITYLKLMYTGSRSGTDVEHNGLTLNGVGNGTIIENIFVPNGSDDGIEFFGGTVNVTNLLVINSDDDMFDMTQGWSGKLENCYGIWENGFISTESDPSGVEADGNLDGNFPDYTGQSNFTIKNMTIVNNGVEMNNVLKIRRGAKANIINALVKGSGTVKSSGYVVDMTDSKGTGDVTSTISITNQMTNTVNATKFGEVLFPNVTVGGSNTGCATDIFAWTGYQF
jgi:hypothetical protein